LFNFIRFIFTYSIKRTKSKALIFEAYIGKDNPINGVRMLKHKRGEAANLRSEHVVKNIVTFVSTKGNKPRSVPISPELSTLIPKRTGKLFPKSCNDSTFRTAIKNAKIKLPRGQMTHVLRHTFASHFMMNGGNILVLQRILGHASIVDTMKYSHFAPDYLEDAVRLNPIAGIE